MRVKVWNYQKQDRGRPNKFISSGHREVRELPDSLADTLATLGLTRMQQEFEGGKVVVYGPIEYRCLNCDEYGHAAGDPSCTAKLEDD
jgi:hypothetical protein